MSMFAELLPLLDPKFLTQIFNLLCEDFRSTALGRRLGRLIILFMLLDGRVRINVRPVVTETVDHIGYGSSDRLASSLGLISIVCALLCAASPTSILGAILLAGYLGSALVPDLRTGSPLSVDTQVGTCFGLLVWSGSRRQRDLRLLPSFRLLALLP